MENYTYLDLLAEFGVGGAHPGGFQLTKEMLDSEKINSQTIILDAGCGTGQTSAYLYNQYHANVYGLELNPIMVQKAKTRFEQQHLPIHLNQGSIEEIPFEDNCFDFILSESVLAFVNKEKALREFNRVLKKGGRLIANEMTLNYFLTNEAQQEIKKFYDLDFLLLESDWKDLLNKTGFNDIKISGGDQSMQGGNTAPEFHFSKDVGFELFDILNQHGQIIIKYQDSLSYRVITCTKK
ncbi:MAG: class I SAM-dependent methyltransferase [Bacillota bacterium]|nr:class I SAM-dependent methyltransferase [Bacillota bacterium]